MKRILFRVVTIGLTAIVLLAVVILGPYYANFLKGPARWKANTVFSPSFSEEKLDRVRQGMTTSEVAAILGRPLPPCKNPWFDMSRDDEPNSGFVYAMPGHTRELAAYHWREVVFDSRGRVARVYRRDFRPTFLDWFFD